MKKKRSFVNPSKLAAVVVKPGHTENPPLHLQQKMIILQNAN